MSTPRDAWTAEILKRAKPSKYGARKKVVDGVTFDSSKEAKRYQELKLLEQAGEIFHLLCQPVFAVVTVNPTGELVEVAKYYADFSYVLADRSTVIEDAKSTATRTPVYRLKKRLVETHYGITIRET